MFPANQIINNVTGLIAWPVFMGVIVIMLVWAGILFLSARGEPSKIDQAKKVVIWATIGIAVGIFAYVAQGFIQWLLGV